MGRQMFTGLIEATGIITAIIPIKGDVRLVVQSETLDFTDVALGDSIASNGICLTVVELADRRYAVDVSRETLQKSAIAHYKVGDMLNLEKAMKPTTRFGGHMVAGHIDGVGVIDVLKKDARSIYVELTLPSELMRYTADKGSITIDGISLTTNQIKVDKNRVCLNIIPHTAKKTNIDRHWHRGALVNVEVDLIARYLERLLQGNAPASTTAPNNGGISNGGISEILLRQTGFID